MKDENDFVSIGNVNHCFKTKDEQEGIVYDNGMLKVKKGYYWSGKCDKKLFLSGQNG